VTEAFEFETERPSGKPSGVGADIATTVWRDPLAYAATDDWERLLGRAFQDAAERTSGVGVDEGACRAASRPQDVAQKLLELTLVGDFQELGSKLDLLQFVQRAFRGFLDFLFGELASLALLTVFALGRFELRSIDVVHG
jgi:hypothetical protein